ncbi:hypothetical protein DM01DRAFT_1300702, partial [Hesseltinella vesiculosa]
MYSPDLYEILSEIVSVSCVSILALIFGRKVASIDGPVRYVRGLLLALYTMGWFYMIIACMSTSTNNGNQMSCSIGFYNVVILHTAVKMVLYVYFIEKAYMLSVPKTKRLASPLYLIQLGLMLPYLAIMGMAIFLHNAVIGDEYPYKCSFGYHTIAVVSALAYDMMVNLLFTGIFFRTVLFPSNPQQTSQQSSSLHAVAKRHGVVSLVSLVMSIFTYGIFILFSEMPRGLMAMTVCTLDVCLVCAMVQWATAHPADHQLLDKLLQQGTNDKRVRLEIKQHQEVVVLTE